MKPFNEYKESFLTQGKKAEKAFAALFDSSTLATRTENQMDHWDVCVGIRVEVKGMKKLDRNDQYPDENIHWLELRGNTGYLGWVYGKADYFAFETEDYFIIVEKGRLHQWIANNITKEYVQQPELYLLYQTRGTQSIITLVKTLDLCSISSAILSKAKFEST